MNSEPFYLTAKEFAVRGRRDFPKEESPSNALIYSSPATLSYNSPGANGFGVKRAGLVIPESIMLLVSPGCCGRNSTILSRRSGYSERMFYLEMDETDLVTGRHLEKIPEAVKEIIEVPEKRPKVVLICITCVDALLGTDLVRVCKKAEEATGVHVVPSYMYALMREGTKPPMTAIRQSIYSLVKKKPKNPHAVNLLGYFAPLYDDSEIYDLFKEAGLTKVREIGRMASFDEYLEMGEANFNLVLNPEARFAADDMMERLGMPYVEMTRFYDIRKIRRQYELLGGALGVQFKDSLYAVAATIFLDQFRKNHPQLTFAIGQSLNANPFELAAALISYGYKVERIFANASEEDLPYIRDIAAESPETRLYTSISPSMMNYEIGGHVDVTLGKDASWYYPDDPNVPFASDRQPFGYRGLVRLLSEIELALRGKSSGESSAEDDGSVSKAGDVTGRRDSAARRRGQGIDWKELEAEMKDEAEAEGKSGRQKPPEDADTAVRTEYYKKKFAAQMEEIKKLRGSAPSGNEALESGKSEGSAPSGNEALESGKSAEEGSAPSGNEASEDGAAAGDDGTDESKGDWT